jgi:deoxyribodipyrimidine photo-lyase
MDVFQKLESAARVSVRRRGPPDPAGLCVVYWMRRSLRAVDNASLDIAVQAANAQGKAVVVFFGLVPVLNGNLRHYAFLVQGLAEVR